MIFRTSQFLTKQMFKLRTEVFINEQGIQSQYEFTGDDQDYVQLGCYQNGQLIGSLRFKIIKQTGYLGRVVIKKELRQQGIGTKMLLKVEELLRKQGVKEIILSSQISVLPFHTKLGYTSVGGVIFRCRNCSS